MIVRVLVFLAATGWVAWLYACGENCTPGTIRACTPNQGECAGATQTCNSSGNWGSCSKLPVPEMCDTLDNDCDGATDEIDAMALVHFVEAVPPVGDSSPRFLVGGLWGSSLLADLREKTAERTPSGDETQLAAVVTGTARAVVSPDGPQAVVAWIDGSSVELRLLDLVAPTPIVDDQATVSFDPGVEPLATIPVFEGNRLVLFTLVDNGDNTRSMLALPCDVTSQSVSCLPGGETTVVGGLSPVADFAVMVPSDPFTPMVLAYYQGPLKVQHVSRTTLQVEGVSRSFGGGRGMPSFAPGPGNSAALAYAVSGMLTLHRFEADTLLCSSPAQALDPMETCPDTVSPTGVGRPSVARRGNEWLIGHVSANEGWGVAIVDATDGTLIEERTETNTSPASTHLAINADDDVLVSQTNTQMGSSVRPLDVPSECTGVSGMSSGYTHSCAMAVDGSVKCWGEYAGGALGQGTFDNYGDSPGEMGDNLLPVDLGTDRSARQVAAGRGHSCAVLDNGSVKCWGTNHMGQLGLGDDTYRGWGPGQMGDALPAVDLGSGRTAVQVSVSGTHTCAVLDNGAVKCWGFNQSGQLGQGDQEHRGDDPGEMGDNLPEVDLGSGRTAIAVALGADHTCAVLDNGFVKCWGENDRGQLGLPSVVDRGDQPGEMGNNLPAVDLGTGRAALSVTAGPYGDHTCALFDDRAIKCWGENTFGQLGHLSYDMGNNLPVLDLGPSDAAISVSAGNMHTCAVLENGTVKCWGRNHRGQLGLGDTTEHGPRQGEMGSSLPAVDLGAGNVAVSVHAGGVHNCAILAGGAVKCWGDGQYGVLGLGETERRGDEPGEMGDALPEVDLF